MKLSTQMQGRLEALEDRLRIGRGSPNTFGSESSFNPPIGDNWSPGELPRGYYIDFRDKPRQPSWPPPWMGAREVQLGVAFAQWGLGCYERFLDGEGEEWLDTARAAGDHIVATLERGGKLDGAWLHLIEMPHTFPLAAPWVSAMAQGECVSLLTRLHLETGEEVYADAALRALKTMQMPVAAGGTLAEVEGRPVLEEYPTAKPSCVLNGAIFAMWGLYDAGLGLDDADARRLFEETTTGLAGLIDRYDAGYWSCYDLYPHLVGNIASPAYHLLHINQLKALDRLSPRPEFGSVIGRFERYRLSPWNRRRALAQKVAFRVLVPRNRFLAHRMPTRR